MATRAAAFHCGQLRAVRHLREAIVLWEGCRGVAKEDSDFDPIRNDPPFEELVAE